MRATDAVGVALAGAAGVFVLAAISASHLAGSGAVTGWGWAVQPGALTEAHAAVASQCEACHEPHQGPSAARCGSCHAANNFGDKQSLQFHANAASCTAGCHVEHHGENSLARMQHVALLDGSLWRWRGPLATELKSREGRGPTEVALDCVSCHSYVDPHQGLFANDCSQCHALNSWVIAEFRHPSTESRACVECHRPPPSHTMMHFEMVSQRVAGETALVEQCYACHTTDSWNNIRGVGWYDHH